MAVVADLDERLGFAHKDITHALNGYVFLALKSSVEGIRFGEVPPVERTTDKGYTARTIVPVFHVERQVGDLVVAVFQPGDGTGSTENYSLDDFVIPEYLRFNDKQERVVPRSKEGILLEACLPLFSIDTGANKITYWATCLEQLSLANQPLRIAREFRLGNDREMFIRRLVSLTGSREGMEIQLTCGYLRNGERFGDPHVVFAPREGYFGNRGPIIQCAGFLSVLSEDRFTEGGDGRRNPLCALFDEIGKVPSRLS